MKLLSGKKILIIGIASKLSIAYGIAKTLYKYGAELSFTYQNNKIKDRVQKITEKFNPIIILPCDLSEEKNIKNLFFNLKKKWSKFDGFIHSVAFAPSNQLSGNYVDVITKEGFDIAHSISSYSFVALAKFSKNMLNKNASLLTLSYLGAERVLPNYNVMGLAKASLEANVRYMAESLGSKKIRVNAISAGPIKTLAAYGIKDFRKMIKFYAKNTPLQRNITLEDIGNAATFLCSNLSSGITGEILHVDCGFNITLMKEI